MTAKSTTKTMKISTLRKLPAIRYNIYCRYHSPAKATMYCMYNLIIMIQSPSDLATKKVKSLLQPHHGSKKSGRSPSRLVSMWHISLAPNCLVLVHEHSSCMLSTPFRHISDNPLPQSSEMVPRNISVVMLHVYVPLSPCL